MNLEIGKWYRITEITDPSPTLAVGTVLQCCVDAGPGELAPEWQEDSECWFADYLGAENGYGTLVTAVEEVTTP